MTTVLCSTLVCLCVCVCVTLCCCRCSTAQSDNVFLDGNGRVVLGDFGQVSACTPTPHMLRSRLTTPSHALPPNPHQAKSDYSRTRAFTMVDGTLRYFASEDQLGAGAPVATSPEVMKALVDGPG